MKTVIFEFQPTPEQPPWLPAAGRREDARMRNTHIDLHDALDRALVAIGNDYPAGHLLDAHAHRRAQLLYGATGVMLVLSEDGGWVVPPQRAVWIPAGVTHQVRMLGVSTRSAYIEPGAARTRGLRSGGGVAAVAPAAAGGRGHAGAVRQGRARRRAGPTAAARGGPRAGAAAAHLPRRATRGWGRCARPSWRRRTSARGRRTGPGGCT